MKREISSNNSKKQKVENKIQDIHKKLNEKFGDNLNQSLSQNVTKLEETEVKARAAYYLGEILFQDKNISDTQREITKIFHEIFTDLTIASYLCCCAMDNSAKIILRRILELGIATVYLWDLPYKFWNWTNYDDHSNDLNFKDMLDYLNNKGYIDFVNSENGSNHANLINKESTSQSYRKLSNVIHGKAVTFKSLDKKSFSYQKEDIIELIAHIIKIENILISLWEIRFTRHFEQLKQKFSPITKYTYEY